jgi:glycosyltransferase involved in cell wall biosynthesis
MNVLAYVHLRNLHHSTGAGRVARELTGSVARRDGVNMHILADGADYRAVADKLGQPWVNLPYHLFSSDTSTQQAKWILFEQPFAERYWPQAEIVHCTTESYVPTAKCRLVVTLHDAAVFDGGHEPGLATLKQQLKWRILYDRLARAADVLHTVSHFSAERLGSIFPSIRSRLRVIYNAVSPLFFEPPDGEGEKYLRRSELQGRRFILLPGGLHYRKNAALVLRAWPALRRRIPDLKLVVVGHNDPEYVKQAKRMADSMFLTGFVGDGELRALYHGAQAVWVPSRYEGFGIPVLEAMACGAPVVASNATAIPEVSGGAAVLVSPDSVDDNVDALAAVLEDGRLREALRVRGRKRAAPFTWAASAAQMHAVYAGLV